MFIMKKQHIKKHDIGLWFRNGDLLKILQPGDHWIRKSKRDTVEVYNRLEVAFQHPMLEALVQEPMLKEHLEVIELQSHERALVWVGGCLKDILPSGVFAFWKTSKSLKIETYDLNDFEFEHQKQAAVMAHPNFRRFLVEIRVPSHASGLMFFNEAFQGVLEPGSYMFWKEAGLCNVRLVDKREISFDVSGQEIMTSDKVTLRLNLVVTYQVQDPKLAMLEVENFTQAIYKEAQLMLRAAVGTRTLDSLLADKEAIGGEIRGPLSERCAKFGVTIRSVGVRDIILPGEMKHLLNQVTEAQKAAEANLIKRREETAAARSQANTARLMAENPQLIRMKELETMQEIMSGAKLTFFLGSGDMKSQLKDLFFTRQEDRTDRS